MSDVVRCPQPEEIRRTLQKGGSEAEIEALAKHFEQCDICGPALDTLLGGDATVTDLQSGKGIVLPEGALLDELKVKLRSLKPAAAVALNQSATLLGANLIDITNEIPATPVLDKTEPLFNFLAPAELPDEIGRIGNYRILRKLGAGGMGIVFLAEDIQLRRKVALKTLLPALAGQGESKERFLREARAMAAVEHEHVIAIHQVGEDRGIPFLAMPLLKGEPLDERMKVGPLPIDEAVRIAAEMADGLAAAHERGLIHRDIKPGNVWLEGERGKVKLLDFGLARAQIDDGQLTKSGAIVGTPAFMSPEQARGDAIDGRADLFSLGAVLYTMLTGKRPFVGESTMTILTALALKDPPAPQTINDDIPARLSALTMRLLAKNRDQRPENARQVAIELRDSLRSDHEPPKTVVLPVLAPEAIPPKRPRRRGFVIGLLSAGLVALAAVIIIRLPTKEGELILEADDDQIEVTIKQAGEKPEVVVVDKQSKRTVKIKALRGEIEARELPDGFGAKTQEFELTRDKKKVFTAKMLLANPAATAEKREAKQPYIETAEFTAWKQGVAALPAEKQLEEVSKKLVELNPGFDGKLTNFYDREKLPDISRGEVTGVWIVTDNMTDISPVRALVGLKQLNCRGTGQRKGQLSDLSPLKGMQLAHLDCSETAVTDLSPLKGMQLAHLHFAATGVSDLSPLQGMPLKVLYCINNPQLTDLSPLKGIPLQFLQLNGTRVSDLSPLVGAPLTDLALGGTKASDLSPLKGMPLQSLTCAGAVSDLTPLRGMPLHTLNCPFTAVSDLSPLKGMPLRELACHQTAVSDLSPLLDCKSLQKLNLARTKVTAAGVAALQTALPSCKIEWDDPGKANKSWQSPSFQQWMKEVAALTAEKQLEAVSKKLMELNPGFDGKLASMGGHDPPHISGGVVKELGVVTDNVTDISPVRVLAGLESLRCGGNKKGRLSDLAPVEGMKLKRFLCDRNPQLSDLSPLIGLQLIGLDCSGTPVSDLSPLRGMPLTDLILSVTQVSDLAPLKGMPLKVLSFNITQVSDLAPLKGMPLTRLSFGSTPVADLAPLEGCPLSFLICNTTQVTDLSPLKGMPLASLACDGTQVCDLSPLADVPLRNLGFSNTQVSDLAPLRNMPLTSLQCQTTRVVDLSPLQELPLTQLHCDLRSRRNIELVRKIGTLKSINQKPVAEFWQEVEAKQAAFLQWTTGVAALPVEKQVDAVRSKLRELNPRFDGQATGKIENGVVTSLAFVTNNVIDISPITALPGLKSLQCNGHQLDKGKLFDLSPLEGMQLASLDCFGTQVSDLSALRRIPLTSLNCGHTPASDLSPLLECKSLQKLSVGQTKVTAAGVAALQTALPNCKIEWDGPANATKAWQSPSFEQWMKDVAALPVEKQLEEVSRKLMELNPGFDGKLTPKIQRGVVVGLELLTDHVTDVSPVRALVELNELKCEGSHNNLVKTGRLSDLSPLEGMNLTMIICGRNSGLSDLSPLRRMSLLNLNLSLTSVSDLSLLKGMPLKSLACDFTQVSDLSPLKGMKLQYFVCIGTQVADLSPLEGSPLSTLFCGNTPIADLTPLKGMKLTRLNIQETQVSDLSLLEGMPIIELHCSITPVSDLSPLKGMPLWSLSLARTQVSDLSPLEGMPLARLSFDVKSPRDTEIVRKIKTLETINNKPAAEFWRDLETKTVAPPQYVETAEFTAWKEGVAKFSPGEQAAAVETKLRELNPGLDGKFEHRIEGGAVTYFRVNFGQHRFIEISPVRALTKVVDLTFYGNTVMDLAPLSGLPLQRLSLPSNMPMQGNGRNHVFDLSPLRGMNLTYLHLEATRVTDLSPLRGMPLAGIECMDTVKDLTPLLQCPLRTLVYHTGDPEAKVVALESVRPIKTLERLNGIARADLSDELSALRQLASVVRELRQTNPGYDGVVTSYKAVNGAITELRLRDHVEDLAALKALKSLKILELSRGSQWQPAHLEALFDLPLEYLGLGGSLIDDVSPLRQLPRLTRLEISKTQVRDLSPLRGAGLTSLLCVGTPLRDGEDLYEVLKSMKSLETFNGKPVAEFWKAMKTKKSAELVAVPRFVETAEFTVWKQGVTALPAEKQLEEVSKKLMELNPGFDGKLTDHAGGLHSVSRGVVAEVKFCIDNVTDISPIRALAGLDFLVCYGFTGKARLSDLSPLQGMQLTNFVCDNDLRLSDLSPLAGMPLKRLDCRGTSVSDLSPLRGMPLSELGVSSTQVFDLAPLKEMKKLTLLNCSHTNVTDLSPLEGSPLLSLLCTENRVVDLSPLKGTKLTALRINSTPVVDLSPLMGMPLKELSCANTQVFDLSPLKGMKLTFLECDKTSVADLSPLEGSPLSIFSCCSTQVVNLSPLKGMKLTRLRINDTPVSELSPLVGMPLQELSCFRTPISDLSPLQELPLTFLACEETKVADLSPLEKVPLKRLICDVKSPRDVDLIRKIKTLETINNKPAADFWKAMEAKQSAESVTVPQYVETAEFTAWKEGVAKLFPGEQAAAVETKLRELNPSLNGKFEHRVEGGVVTGFHVKFGQRRFLDLSPVRALTKVVDLTFYGNTVTDLAPLSGMPLQRLSLPFNMTISDNGQDEDKNAQYEQQRLSLPANIVMGGKEGNENRRNYVFDLSPLRGMKLTYLHLEGTRITDLSPLRGMPLTGIECMDTVKDLTPLLQCPLRSLNYQTGDLEAKVAAFESVKSIRTLEYVNGIARTDWPDELAALRKLASVVRELRQANPDYDGVVNSYKAVNGAITELRLHGHVEDLAAFQALKSLKILELVRGRPWQPVHLEALFDLPLEDLGLGGSLIDDVSPLRQLPQLTRLEISRTRVRDLSPLRGAALTSLLCVGTPLRDGDALCEVLKSMKSLETFNGKPPAEFCGDSAAVAELEEMLQQLVASNPAYDRLVPHRKLEAGHVVELTLSDNALSNFSALQKLPALTSLSLGRGSPWHAANWEFLKGMKLTSLDLRGAQIANLTPLKGMPLEHLEISGNNVVKDLSPLEGLPLKSLIMFGWGERRTDLSPLGKLPLEELHFDRLDVSRDTPMLKSIKTLKTINRRPADEFWKGADAQQK